MKSKAPALSIVLYILAAILLIYSVWAAVYSINFFSTLIQGNQLVFQGNEFDIVSFFMTSVVQYFIYTALLFTLGWMYHKNILDQEEDFDFDDNVALLENYDELESEDTLES